MSVGFTKTFEEFVEKLFNELDICKIVKKRTQVSKYGTYESIIYCIDEQLNVLYVDGREVFKDVHPPQPFIRIPIHYITIINFRPVVLSTVFILSVRTCDDLNKAAFPNIRRVVKSILLELIKSPVEAIAEPFKSFFIVETVDGCEVEIYAQISFILGNIGSKFFKRWIYAIRKFVGVENVIRNREFLLKMISMIINYMIFQRL